MVSKTNAFPCHSMRAGSRVKLARIEVDDGREGTRRAVAAQFRIRGPNEERIQPAWRRRANRYRFR